MKKIITGFFLFLLCLNVYASRYSDGTLEDISTDEEWNEIENRLNKIQ